MKKCDHYFLYEHTIWDAGQNKGAIGRICSKCGKMQMAIADNWKPVGKLYVDMKNILRSLNEKDH
jgi:hypothetical protein